MTQLIRVKDVMTQEELSLFDELNQLILTSVTSRERQFYNAEVAQLVEQVKERYVKEKERDHS